MGQEVDALRADLCEVTWRRCLWATASLLHACLGFAADPEYQDRLIEGGALAPLASEGEEAGHDPSGPARSLRIEGTASRTEQGERVRRESGISASARVDTLKYGALTLDLTLRHNPSDVMVTAWQRGLAFDGGWRADNGVGMLNTPAIDLARQQYRFYLPTFPMVGLTSEWVRPGGMQAQAAAGEPGVFDGLRVGGFSRLGGVVATGGVQWNVAPGWQTGVQAIHVNNVLAGTDIDNPNARTQGGSLFAATSWQGGGHRAQLNVMDGKLGDDRHRFSAWFDGESKFGRYRHNYGVFRFDPGATWGYAPVNGDLEGGYYRLNYQSQQWVWTAGVDSVNSISGKGVSGVYGNGSLRYQVDRSLGVGGGGTVRHAGADGGSAYAFVDKQTDLGTTRLQVDVVRVEGGSRGQQFVADQAWATRVGLRLSTSLSVGRIRESNGSQVDRASLAAFGGIDLTNTLTLEGDVRIARERGAQHLDGRYANVALVWRFSPRWSLNGLFYVNRAELKPFITIDPIVPIEQPTLAPRDRAIFVTLRYEDHAGTPVSPLGGMPGSGAGTLMGYVYLDANDDGRRSAGEQGAPNVTVILDGRFSVRTDPEGKFEFPLVAAGLHVLYVLPDNLALPWAILGEGRRDVTITTRETTRVEIGATRNR